MTPDWLDIRDDRFRPLVLANAPPEVLGAGFRWLEGPIWFADQEALLVSDLPDDRIMRWTEGAGVSVFRTPAGFANGACRDLAGRLVNGSHQHRHVERTELDGSRTVLAAAYQGRRLNAPNDVVCKSDGSIWFTDPIYGISTDYEGGKGVSEQPARVYRLDPDGTLHAVAEDVVEPNGLAFSPDESLLYISETGDAFAAHPDRFIRRFAVGTDNTLSGGARFHAVQPGYADGFKVDVDGNVWSSAGDGVHCIAPDGVLIGKILLPATVSNLVFGGRARSRLFVCASQTLYAIYTNTRGCVRP